MSIVHCRGIRCHLDIDYVFVSPVPRLPASEAKTCQLPQKLSEFN